MKDLKIDLNQKISNLSGEFYFKTEYSKNKEVEDSSGIQELKEMVRDKENKEKLEALISSLVPTSTIQVHIVVNDIIKIALDNFKNPSGLDCLILSGLFGKIRSGGVQKFSKEERSLLCRIIIDTPSSIIVSIPKAVVVGMLDPYGDLLSSPSK